MSFNQGNDPNDVPQIDPNKMTLRQLEQSQDIPLQVKYRAQTGRTELSISIGDQAVDICYSSKLWHPYQNVMAQFQDGIYQTMHHSYIGNCRGLGGYTDNTRQVDYILGVYPNIRTLNIMLDLGSIYGVTEPRRDPRRELVMSNLVRLISQYAHQLVSFKLWARGPLFAQLDIRHWYSVLMREFTPRLWPLLTLMAQCRVLWLDLEEDVQPVAPGADIGPPEVYKLEHLIHNQPNVLRNMRQLEEFRFAAEYIDPFAEGAAGNRVLTERLAPIATLQRVHLLYPLAAHQCIFYPEHFARRFRENVIVFQEQVPFDQLDLTILFRNFNALTRLAIYLAQNGPRFSSILQALTQVANLQVLQLTIIQPCLFTPEEVYAHRRLSEDGTLIRTPRLLALQVLAIDLHLSMQTCADITVAPLFPGDRARQLPNPLPSLVTFDMSVRDGECRACGDQDDCIRNSVIQWFEPMVNVAPVPPIAMITYSNALNYTLGLEQVVSGTIPVPPLHPILQ